jgi:hypothetical protein
MLVVQFALWQHAQHVASAAAQEGARAARLEGGTRAAGATTARAFVDALGSAIVLRPRVTAVRDADSARVEVDGEAITLVPWLHLPVRAVAQAPTERFRPEARGFGISGGALATNPRGVPPNDRW